MIETTPHFRSAGSFGFARYSTTKICQIIHHVGNLLLLSRGDLTGRLRDNDFWLGWHYRLDRVPVSDELKIVISVLGDLNFFSLCFFGFSIIELRKDLMHRKS